MKGNLNAVPRFQGNFAKRIPSYSFAQIESGSANMLWVGLGVPKQELWMAQHLGKACVPVMIGVGAAPIIDNGYHNRKELPPSWVLLPPRFPRRLAVPSPSLSLAEKDAVESLHAPALLCKILK